MDLQSVPIKLIKQTQGKIKFYNSFVKVINFDKGYYFNIS